MSSDNWLRAGRVGRPHGLDGSVHVTQPNAVLLSLGVTVRVNGQERVIVRRAGTDEQPILRFEGCEDRPTAESLRGAQLEVDRAQAPQLERDEWWAEDLEGCAVVSGGVRVGTVTRLLAMPSCEVLAVDRDGAGELLVPLVADAVRSVDVAAKQIEVDLSFLGEG